MNDLNWLCLIDHGDGAPVPHFILFYAIFFYCEKAIIHATTQRFQPHISVGEEQTLFRVKR